MLVSVGTRALPTLRLLDSIAGVLSGLNSNGVMGTIANAGKPWLAAEIGDYFKGKDQVGSKEHILVNPDKTAQDFISQYVGGQSINKVPIENCAGCWQAKTPDGLGDIVYRPAGTATGSTKTTASVDINHPNINSVNLNKKGLKEHLKLKFPIKSKVKK